MTKKKTVGGYAVFARAKNISDKQPYYQFGSFVDGNYKLKTCFRQCKEYIDKHKHQNWLLYGWRIRRVVLISKK